MLVLYDFQEDFKDVESGEFKEGEIVSVRQDHSSASVIKVVEDVKTLLISERKSSYSGIFIRLNKIPGLMAGDRITITGRIGDEAPRGPVWSIALLSWSVEDGHLTQHISPGPGAVFAISHILETKEIEHVFTVHTIGWGGVLSPLMDFYVDGILITRNTKVNEAEIDTRTAVYSLEEDEYIKHISTDDVDSFGNKLLVVRSGNPIIRIFQRGDLKAIHVGTRVNDWDGVDLLISRMRLRAGNKYKILVTGRIDGNVPDGSVLMLQGIPSYGWRSNINITEDEEFTLEHVLTRSELEKWTSVRITTNGNGASVAFYIYNISIERL